MMRTRAIPFFAAFFVFGMTVTATAQQLRSEHVIIAIDAAIDSLREQPNQFTLNVMAVGAMGTASGGGTGIKVEVHGGGPGSETTGMVARADGTQVTIAQRTADAALKQEAERAVNLLTDIRAAL